MRDSKNILKCLVLNCQSICNKCTQVMECATDRDADIMFLSETWLRSRKNNVTAEVDEYGYTLYHTIRKNRAKETGGGVGVMLKKTLNVKRVKSNQFQSFEHHAVKINMRGNTWTTLISIYRLDYEPIDVFFTEFRQLCWSYLFMRSV